MKTSLALLPYVFIGGGLGASLRFCLGLMISTLSLKVWSATVLVNLIGTACYCLSVKVFGGERIHHEFFRVGLLGSLTTFSTLSFEIATSLKQGQFLTAGAIFTLNIIAGVLIAIGILR